VDAGFAVGLALSGVGEVTCGDGMRMAVRAGDAFVVPWAAGRWSVEGPDVVVCRPPLPQG
jgi:uncharacterized cupin superfamily protein